MKVLVFFFVCICLPSLYFVDRAYEQLEMAAFLRHREAAENIFNQLNDKWDAVLASEEKRSFEEYSFLDYRKKTPSRSALSKLPGQQSIRGLIGYFQLNPDGSYQNPLIPETVKGWKDVTQYDIDKNEFLQRKLKTQEIYNCLANNDIIRKETQGNLAWNYDFQQTQTWGANTNGLIAQQRGQSYEVPQVNLEDKDELIAQVALPQLASQQLTQKWSSNDFNDKVSDLNIDKRYIDNAQQEISAYANNRTQKKQSQRGRRTTKFYVNEEQTNVLQSLGYDSKTNKGQSKVIQKTDKNKIIEKKEAEVKNEEKTISFIGEIDPFQSEILDNGQIIFYRSVFKNKKRFIQGFLVKKDLFFQDLMKEVLQSSSLNGISNMIAASEGQILCQAISSTTKSKKNNNYLLLNNTFAPPLNNIELLITLTQLGKIPGTSFFIGMVILFFSILIIGLMGIYRIGATQINLAQQRNDFVSSVSHELRTPLTSIRMYGEMLRSGWVKEETRKSYYDFIFFESERLSRLISNVLQFSKLTNHNHDIELNKMDAKTVFDVVRSKVSTQVESSGFTLECKTPEEEDQFSVKVNDDAFSQIFINLVDNAIKFSVNHEPKTILIGFRKSTNQQIEFYVRDYGPGISNDQKKKIFDLFYRSENELTRKTTGTGIGLALVKRLCDHQNAKIRVVTHEQGSEFIISLPIVNN